MSRRTVAAVAAVAAVDQSPIFGPGIRSGRGSSIYLAVLGVGLARQARPGRR
jgi:hypothetical protein